MISPRVASLTLFAMLAFAGNSLLCRIALRDTAIDAASFTSIRLASGALVLAAIMLARRSHPLSAGSWPMAAMLFGYAAFFSLAYRQLTAATGALLLFGAVQTSMLGYGFASGERLRPMQVAGLFVAVGGLVYMLLPGLSAPPLGRAARLLLGRASWAVYSVLGRGVKDPVGATAGNFLRSLPFTLVLSLATIGDAKIDPAGVGYAVLSGAITSGLGYVLWYAALPALKATSAATVQLSVPALAALGGVVLPSAAPTPRLLVASAAILGGIALPISRRK